MNQKNPRESKPDSARNIALGFVKTWNYFEALSKTDAFMQKIMAIRKRYLVPDNGYTAIKVKEWSLPNTEFVYDYFDGYPLPPPEWASNFKKYRDQLNTDVEELCIQHALPMGGWGAIIKVLIFYNELELPVSYTEQPGLCFVSDSLEDSSLDEIDDSADLLAFPIAIHISPYASQRDVLDYVKNVFTDEIVPRQAKYLRDNIKLGKVKTKKSSIQERNQFIYNHQHLPIKKIRRLLSDMGVSLDDGTIGKILSLERKKRKEV